MEKAAERGPKWKSENVRGHSFDYLDMDDFYDPSCMTRVSYLFIYVIVIKSFLVYVADAYSAGKHGCRYQIDDMET